MSEWDAAGSAHAAPPGIQHIGRAVVIGRLFAPALHTQMKPFHLVRSVTGFPQVRRIPLPAP